MKKGSRKADTAPAEEKLGKLPENVVFGNDGKTPLVINSVEDASVFLSRFTSLPVRGKSGYTTYWNGHGYSNPEHIKTVTPMAHLRLLLITLDAHFQNRAQCVAAGGELKIGREWVKTADFDGVLPIFHAYEKVAPEIVAQRTAVNRLLAQFVSGDEDEREFAKSKLTKLGYDAEKEVADRAQQAAAAAAAAEAADKVTEESTTPADGGTSDNGDGNPSGAMGSLTTGDANTASNATEGGTESGATAAASSTSDNGAAAPAPESTPPKRDDGYVAGSGARGKGKGGARREHAHAS